MSKRDLLRKANAANLQNRGTEAVLNEEVPPKSSPSKAAPSTTTSVEDTPVVKIINETVAASENNRQQSSIEFISEKQSESSTDHKIELSSKNVEKAEIIEKTETVDSSISSKKSKITKPAISANLAKYTGSKISKSIMLTAEDNKYLIKQAAARKKPIQDIFGEVMADEIEEVKKGNIDEDLAESFLKLKANNERRNVLIPEDLSIAIADTASEIPLKQGKFILYALSRRRMQQ